ncbi:MAG: S41 family peptidase [Firmicutes bacterium]|nr:S41 family peptidase [Bacillota bacterium]
MKDREKYADKFNLKELVCLLIVVAFVSLVTGFVVSYRMLNDKSKDSDMLVDQELSTFIKNYNYIVDNYYGDIDKNKLLNAALEGVLNSLDDPYTAYIDESKVNNFNITLEGSYEGLGIEVIVNEDSKLQILTVFDNSPAFKAGLNSGDIILRADNEEILSSQKFADVIKTKANEPINLLINRGDQTFQVSVKRELITLESVTSKAFEKNGQKIGYLGISIFANNTYGQFKTALEQLESKNINSLIIDVRSNTGGHLTSVENILGLFLDSSHIIYKIKDEAGVQAVYSEGSITKKYPIVILTNEMSASASEILTAALKEEYGAKSVGVKTYGKGSAQELITLPDGTQYKITTKKWLTPYGHSIDFEGIDVDLPVDFNSDYYDNPVDDNDKQLQAAIDMLLQN